MGRIQQYFWGIIFLTFSIVLAISLISYNRFDRSVLYDNSNEQLITNYLGSLGSQLASIFLFMFGCSSILWIFSSFILGLTFLRILIFKKYIDRAVVLIFMSLFLSIAANISSFELFSGVYPGGIIGIFFNKFLSKYLDIQQIKVFVYLSLFAYCIILFRFSYNFIIYYFLNKIPINKILLSASYVFFNIKKKVVICYENFTGQSKILKENNEAAEDIFVDPIWQEYLQPAQAYYQEDIKDIEKENIESDLEECNYKLPSSSLLTFNPEKISSIQMQKEGEMQARVLENKLTQFNIRGSVVAINHGPSVTLFEYQPAIDTKISNIIARENDLALALQALSLRIIAPIPGRSVVGFEVAKTTRNTIFFSELASSQNYNQFTGLLPLILGKDSLANCVIVDLTRLPHLLIAGSTGSGKSVGLHGIIMSLLCSKKPQELRLILIDPKRLEFTQYADVAHLLFPLVTEPARAIAVLNWAVKTMEERYNILAQKGVRNLEDYNKIYPEVIPYIVIIIDELADLMMTSGKEVEHLLTRLAQMSRAAGIHLIVATQRPSVDVITGIIKVNFPSRIAFKVTSKVDSRTIIDEMGAEKLLGKGDMLFLDSSGKLQRIQGVYVPDEDVRKVVNFIKSQIKVTYQEFSNIQSIGNNTQEVDEIQESVIEFMKTKKEISISLLQRVFKIGYNRSARLMDQLEAQGYILPSDGSKMRKIAKSGD